MVSCFILESFVIKLLVRQKMNSSLITANIVSLNANRKHIEEKKNKYFPFTHFAWDLDKKNLQIDDFWWIVFH